MRTYQAGVVYIDKYGRETPVFTNKAAGTQLSIASSSSFNRLIAEPTNTPPSFATHYKVFLKETSNEYYNLALDRYYDAEDGNVWLSFPSSERNKISEESYLIAKKQHDNSTPVTSLSRYRVMSISNEAPDFIKTVGISLGTESVINRSVMTVGTLGFSFEGPNPEANPQFAPNFAGNKVIFSLGNLFSDEYEVQDYKVVNQPTTTTTLYELSINKGIGADAEFLSNVAIGSNFSIRVVGDKEETKPEYQGRFFVKIPRDIEFDANIMESFQALDPEYSVLGSISFTLSGGRSQADYKGEVGPGRNFPFGYYWIDWGNNYSTSGPGNNNGSTTRHYVAGRGVWMNGENVSGGAPEPASGPQGQDVDNPGGVLPGQRTFFSNFGPITNGSDYFGYSYAGIKSTDGLPKYIDSMSGSCPPDLATNGPGSYSTSRPISPTGFLRSGNSVRFLNQTSGELSEIYRITEAFGYWHDRGETDEGNTRNYAYTALYKLDRPVEWQYAPGYNGNTSYTEHLTAAADIVIQAVKPVVPEGNRLLTSNNPAIFETEPKEAVDLDLYYQASDSLAIANYNNPVELEWYNCFSYGNGAESNRIRDDYNAVTIDKGATVSSILADPYGEERKGSGFIFSQIYNSTSGINRLNQFIQAQPITKDLNPVYGTIQKLHARDTDLITLCEDKCFRVLANKDALFNADGNSNITSNNNVLGQATPYAGEFGISKNPESFADYGFRLYFTDKNRGTVLRLSRDGLTEISNKGMSDFFADVLKINNNLLGTYDADTGLYNLTLPVLGPEWSKKLNPIQSDNLSTACEDNIQNPPEVEDWVHTTVSFKESVDGWTSRKSFMPESGVSLNDRYFTFNEGLIWVHGQSPLYNNFYGEQYVSSFNVLVNDSPNVVKGYTALNYSGTKSRELEYEKNNTNEWYSIAEVNAEGWRPTSTRIKNAGWYVNYVRTNLEAGEIKEFENKEGKYFNYIKTLAVCGEAFGLGYSTGTTSDPQNYLLNTFIDFSCSNTGSSTDPDEELRLWTDWDEIIGNNDVTIANETTALSAKCIIEGFYNTLSDYTNISKSNVEFKYFATAGLQVGTQLYDYNTEQPLTAAGLGLYVPPTTRVEIPNDAALDPNNTSVNPPDNYDIIIYNSSGIITNIVQYNTITGSCSNTEPTGPLTFEVTTTANSTSVELPYDASGTYSGIVNWGDGSTSTNSYANRTHTYATPGVYTLEISGRSSKINFGTITGNTGSPGPAILYTKLVKFGNPMQFEVLRFGGSGALTTVGAINLDFSAVEDTPSFASNASIESLTQGLPINNFNNIGNWDVSNVVNMEEAFRDNVSFNQNISSWNVGNVTNMVGMFEGGAAFNQNINSWDVSSVTDMNHIFYKAILFNQPLNLWNVSSVISMNSTFREAIAFDQPIGNWDVSNVTGMTVMFGGLNASSPTIFNQDISSWDVSSVTNMSSMFIYNHYFNQNINSWNTSSLTNLSSTFYDARVFNQPLNSWDTSNVTRLSSTFSDAIAFNQPLNSWDVSNVTFMNGTFSDAESFNQPLSNWNVSNVTNMVSMFRQAAAFNQNINSWDVSSVTTMVRLFSEAEAFNQPLSNWNTSSVTSMSEMFRVADAFNQSLNTQSVTVGGNTYTAWNVSSVTDMSLMFFGTDVFDGNIVDWDVSSVTDMTNMFNNADSFNKNISSWNVSNVTSMFRMFYQILNSFNQDLSSWSVANVTNCTDFNGQSVGWTLPKPSFTNCTP